MQWPVAVFALGTAVSVLLGVDAGALQAQAVPEGWNPGALVRVRAASPRATRWVSGHLLKSTADSVHLLGSGQRPATLHFAVADLRGIEVSQGRHNRAGRGALVGGIAGAVIGLLSGLAIANDGYFQVDGGDVVLITATFGAVGAGIGALIGLAFHTEEWRAVSPASLVAEMAPRAGVLNLGWRIPW